jgi:hypothetical protein
MATCATYHGIIGIQNGTHYSLDNKTFWRYEGFVPEPEGGDLPVEVFAFKGSSASAKKGIYLLDARAVIGRAADKDGRTAYILHLYAIDVRIYIYHCSCIVLLIFQDMQPMPEGRIQ